MRCADNGQAKEEEKKRKEEAPAAFAVHLHEFDGYARQQDVVVDG